MNTYCFQYCIHVVDSDGIANSRKIFDIMYFFYKTSPAFYIFVDFT